MPALQNNVWILFREIASLKKDMSKFLHWDESPMTHSKRLDPSWLITNDLQLAIADPIIDELPTGLFKLDPH